VVGLLVTLVIFPVLVAVVLAVLVAVTVVPVFFALQMADARRFSTGRWFAVSAFAVVAGLLLAYVLHKHDAPRIAQVLPLFLTWAGPAALWLLSEDQVRIGGRAGSHE